MEVILLQDVQGLGSAGTKVKVKDGYARNFLFPKKYALISSPANYKVFEERNKRLARQAEQEKKTAAALAEQLAGFSCTIPMKAGDDGKLFGSVTALDIAKALEVGGFIIDKKKIELSESIKALGVYQVSVRLTAETIASLKVWVVKE